MSDIEKDEDDSIVTMPDYLEQQTKLEQDMIAVLGASDDKNCTYDKGYMRQALYSCTTCTDELAGICLACSYHCHEGHKLVELYTKRNFKCDCGNGKFKGKKCALLPEKDAANELNAYNHNFKGTYCKCVKPYPDPDDSVNDEMIQCIVCEDWYHYMHLEKSVNATKLSYEEMICDGCTEKLPFLTYYTPYLAKSATETQESELAKGAEGNSLANGLRGNSEGTMSNGTEEKSVSENGTEEKSGLANGTEEKSGLANGTEEKSGLANSTADEKMELAIGTSANGLEKVENGSENSNEETRKGVKRLLNGQPANERNSVDASNNMVLGSVEAAKNAEEKVDICLLKKRENSEGKLKPLTGASFWLSSLRKALCRCADCMKLYEESQVLFLLDEFDTVQSYEGRSERNPTQYEEGLKALQTLGRVQQVEVMHKYNEFKSQLSDFLKTFAESGEVVRKEDISGFFDELKRKKQETENDPPISHFCR